MTAFTVGSYILFPHQIAAIEWMHEREKDDVVRGGFLCDEMGLGKTITTVGFMHLHPVNCTLILTPLAVCHQWVNSIRSASASPIYILKKQSWCLVSATSEKEVTASTTKFFIANYDKLISSEAAFQMQFDRVICDEAHVLRNYESKKVQRLKTLDANRYWMLTGTPIVNRDADLASLMHILCRTINPEGFKSMKTLKGWMQDYALSRSVNLLRQELPNIFPKEPIVKQHRIEFTTEEEALFYRGMQNRIAAQLMYLMAHDNTNTLAFLTLLLRLRQISVHPQVYIASKKRSGAGYGRDDWQGSSSKIDYISKILMEEDSSQGVVIFCNFKEEMDVLRDHLRTLPCVGKVLMYHGGLSDSQRVDVVAESEKIVNNTHSHTLHALQTILDKAAPTRPLPEVLLQHIHGFMGIQHTVMLVQIQCGGTGLNLQHMSSVIFTTPWWTAALMDQAAGRVLRIGQTKQVVIHHIHLSEEDTVSLNIDNYINGKVELKRELCRNLLEAANHTTTVY
jgi:SNF2 family DNA or RNA helicase